MWYAEGEAYTIGISHLPYTEQHATNIDLYHAQYLALSPTWRQMISRTQMKKRKHEIL